VIRRPISRSIPGRDVDSREYRTDAGCSRSSAVASGDVSAGFKTHVAPGFSRTVPVFKNTSTVTVIEDWRPMYGVKADGGSENGAPSTG